jgi:hypothetical protein
MNTMGHAVINPLAHECMKSVRDSECRKIITPDTMNAVQQDIINANRIPR